MRTGLTVLVALTALAAPGAASAKGIESVTACGADRCRDASSGDEMLDHALIEGGPRADRPRDRAPFFRVVVGLMSGPEPGDVLYREKLWVPWLRVAAERDPTTGRLRWYRPGRRHENALRLAVTGLHPLPAREMPVRVQLRATPVAEPAAIDGPTNPLGLEPPAPFGLAAAASRTLAAAAFSLAAA